MDQPEYIDKNKLSTELTNISNTSSEEFKSRAIEALKKYSFYSSVLLKHMTTENQNKYHTDVFEFKRNKLIELLTEGPNETIIKTLSECVVNNELPLDIITDINKDFSWNTVEVSIEEKIAIDIKRADELALYNHNEQAINLYIEILDLYKKNETKLGTIYYNPVTEYRVAELTLENIYYRIILVALANDAITALQYLELLNNSNPKDTITCVFLRDVVNATINYEINYLTKCIRDYNSVHPVDNWTTNILLRIKNINYYNVNKLDNDNI